MAIGILEPGRESRPPRNELGISFTPFGRPMRSHRGKAPKNYQRTDEAIYEDVCERLMEHAEIDASDILVAVNDGEVQLSGTVENREEKRLVEDVIAEVRGVHDVQNDLKTRRRGPASMLGLSSKSGVTAVF